MNFIRFGGLKSRANFSHISSILCHLLIVKVPASEFIFHAIVCCLLVRLFFHIYYTLYILAFGCIWVYVYMYVSVDINLARLNFWFCRLCAFAVDIVWEMKSQTLMVNSLTDAPWVHKKEIPKQTEKLFIFVKFDFQLRFFVLSLEHSDLMGRMNCSLMRIRIITSF